MALEKGARPFDRWQHLLYANLTPARASDEHASGYAHYHSDKHRHERIALDGRLKIRARTRDPISRLAVVSEIFWRVLSTASKTVFVVVAGWERMNSKPTMST